MNSLTRIKAGEPFVAREGAYNAFCDVAEAHRNGTGGRRIEGTEHGPRLVARVKNNTGAQINFGACVMLDENPASLQVYSVSDNGIGDNTEFAFSAVFRSSTVTTMFPQRYGIALESIPSGDIGQVCIRGACVAAAGSASSGWLMPIFTSSSSGFALTTKRTGVQVLYALSANPAYSMVMLDDAPWQTRRSNAAASANVTSTTRGSSFALASTTDGFTETKSFTLSGGVWEGLVGTSIIEVPCDGIYDIRYNVYVQLLLNAGSGDGPIGSGASINVRNFQIQARLSLVDDDTGAVTSGINYPGDDGNGAGLINLPVMFTASTIAYAGQSRGSATIEVRHQLLASTSRAVGIVMRAVADTGSYTIPGMSVVVMGTGIIRPAEQDIYVAPPVP